MGLFIAMFVLGLFLLGMSCLVEYLREPEDRPYDWALDGECGPQRHHVRVLKAS